MKTVYGFFMAKTFNTQLSEDLTSDVFVTAFEQFNLSNSEQHINDKEKYIFGVAKITWLKYLRSKYADKVTYVEDIQDFEQYAVQTIQDTKSRSLVDRALPYIEQLPEKQRAVLQLRFRDGLSLKEICEHMDTDMNYVKTTQKRGIASLKRLIQGDIA